MKVRVQFPDGEIREVAGKVHIASEKEYLGHKFLKGSDQVFTMAEWIPEEDPLYVFHQTTSYPYWTAKPRTAEDLLHRASKQHADPKLAMTQEDAEALTRKKQESK